MKNILAKLFLFILSCIPIIFLALFGMLISYFSGKSNFYVPFIIAVTVGILFFVCNAFFKFLKPKLLMIVSRSFVSLCLLVFLIHVGINFYQSSIPTLADAEVDLLDYQPFHSNSKVVSLKEDSTLKLEEDLPVLDGATALYPLYAAFVQATYPEKTYNLYDSEVMGNTTPKAYNNLISGKVDIIFAAGPSKSQLSYAKLKGIELKLTPIGREAFVFFVNSKNPVKGLTVEQIQGIYSGEITNWSEVGGKNQKIKAFQRPADSGSQTTLEKLMGDIPLMEPPKEDVVAGMGGIIQQTSNYTNYKNAIGYSFRFFSMDMIENNAIRHLDINGIYPSKATIRNGEYPLADEFYAITAGSDNPHIEAFIEWILSEQGQYLVEKTGYVPVKEF